MIQISKEQLYEMALELIGNNVDRVYGSFDDSEVNRWLIDSIATIGGIVNLTYKIVNEGEVEENDKE